MKPGKWFLFISSAMLLIALVSSCRDELKNLNCNEIDAAYNADIKPIVQGNCNTAGCHGAGSSNGDYTTYAGLKAAADNGSLDEQVNIEKKMPPTGKLPLDSRKKIRCWIDAGAPNN
jgi:hypothetical protein